MMSSGVCNLLGRLTFQLFKLGAKLFLDAARALVREL